MRSCLAEPMTDHTNPPLIVPLLYPFPIPLCPPRVSKHKLCALPKTN